MCRGRNRHLRRLGPSASVGGTPRDTLSSGSEAFVPVMEAAHFKQRHDTTPSRWLWSALVHVENGT